MGSKTDTKRTERFEDVSEVAASGGGFQRVNEEFLPAVRDTLGKVQNQFDRATSFLLPGIDRTTPLTQDQLDAFALARNFANAQSPNVEAASRFLNSNLSPGGISPQAREAASLAAQDAENAALQRFALRGRSGSPAEAAAVARGVAQAQAPFLFQAAENQANRGLQAANMANQLGVQAQNLLFGQGGFQQQRADQLAQEQFSDALFPQQRDEAAVNNLVTQFATLFPAFGQETGDFSTVDTSALRTGDISESTRQSGGLMNNIMGGLMLARGAGIV